MYTTHQPPTLSNNPQFGMQQVELQAQLAQHMNFPGSLSIDQQQSRPVVYQEYLEGWLLQWRTRKNWIIEIPKIKECKKRKEEFTKVFSQVFYKAPYKYHLHVIGNGIQRNDNVVVQVALQYENGESINKGDDQILSNGKREIHPKKMEKIKTRENAYEVIIGPYQYNVCSFRQDGRKFRLVLNFSSQNMNSQNFEYSLICTMTSQPFVIRAKKPIKNPGTRSKRKRMIEKKSSSKKRKEKDEEKDEEDSKVKNTQTLTDHLRTKYQQNHQIINFPPPPLGMGNLLQNNLDSNLLPNPGDYQQQSMLEPVFQMRENNQRKEDNNSDEEEKKDFNLVVLNEYTNMSPEKRISLITRLLEISFPTELDTIHKVFFCEKDKKNNFDTPIFNEMEKLIHDDNDEDFP